eukprot:CAMPEP_0197855212 /NCGR_PEP_ID=MMETSP1438-20131217/26176_1 /TAXON_ID=1461541 /ORGANISM="Pterosperma sp., Strain CCMP1384" /LENGTH=117 /DNA_ID=CAMNT_0043470231 /DNA_START=24 /DNA_END=374 /DNA_ORIENTATION=-
MQVLNVSGNASAIQQQINDQLADANTIHELKTLVKQDPVDIEKLRSIAREQGLASNKVRKKVWPKLLGVNPHASNAAKYRAQAVKGHNDSSTVTVDVERSAWLAGRVENEGSASQGI